MSLALWTVYDHPSDFPGNYVARLFILDKPTPYVLIADTLDELRAALLNAYPDLMCMCRHAYDDPNIVEVWLWPAPNSF